MEANKIKYNPLRCLNVHELKAYSKNLLPKEERMKVEQHIHHCELCKDALEGYSFFKENNIESKVSSINKRIRKRTAYLYFNKGKFLFNNNFHQWISNASIAASIIIVLGTLLYINYSWNRYSSIMAEQYIEENKISTATVIEKEESFNQELLDKKESYKTVDTQIIEIINVVGKKLEFQVDKERKKETRIKSLILQKPTILTTDKSFITPAVYNNN
jgi:hypothetical protein